MRIAVLILTCTLYAIGAFAMEQEATSLTGNPLYAPELSPDEKKDLDAKLNDARAEWKSNPGSADTWIWYGRRTAYMGKYREAIDIFTQAIARFPEDARLYRHRGHRYLTIRKIETAIKDFEKAAALIAGKPDQVEPDGLPNAKNIPLSTLNTNIFYHLGLSHYLLADYDRAEDSYRKCLRYSKNDDMVSATSHWLYMTLRRAGKEKEASAVLDKIHAKMEIIEDFEYHQLLLMYKGEKKPEEVLKAASEGLSNATAGYGIGNWYLYNGDKSKAFEEFRRIVSGKQWASFGYLAAEAELARK